MKGFQCDSKCTKLTIHPTGHPNESFNVHMHPSDSTKLSLAMPDETKQVHISRAPTIGLHAGKPMRVFLFSLSFCGIFSILWLATLFQL